MLELFAPGKLVESAGSLLRLFLGGVPGSLKSSLLTTGPPIMSCDMKESLTYPSPEVVDRGDMSFSISLSSFLPTMGLKLLLTDIRDSFASSSVSCIRCGDC